MEIQNPEINHEPSAEYDGMECEIPVIDVEWKITLHGLHRAAMEGNWEAAKSIFDGYSHAKTARINNERMTALHVAAKCGRSAFVKNLVGILTPEELQKTDQRGLTALHYAVVATSVKTVDVMVSKNKNLPQVCDVDNNTPFFHAAYWRHPSKSKQMLEYLYTVTNGKVYSDPESSSNLIVAITASGSHDIALRVLGRHSDLALALDKSGSSILNILATQPSAFSQGTKSFSWERSTGHGMNIVSGNEQRQKESVKLVHLVCKELQKKSDSAVMDYFLPPDRPGILHLATKNGVFELVQVCLQYFPDLIWYSSPSDGKLLLHVAVEHRRVQIFIHIIRLIGQNPGVYARIRVEGQNNILHLAAKLAPIPQLHSVPGPVFQMQRELQWFKAVESIVYTDERVAKNGEDKTPVELFFKEHNQLVTAAKEWMKDTSNSCMVVAALVATVAFASMITVPGGNDSGTGMPVLSKKNLFVVFSVANASSMISSAVALLMFLSLQTSRFTDEDFLEKLPQNLLKGLLSLFVAVATMMIAFGTAIGLALQRRIKWGYIPITVVACIPTIIFTRLQLPLLFQTLVVTSGILGFGHRSNRRIRCLEKIGYNLVPSHLV